MNKFIFNILILSFSFTAMAQQVCNQTIVYFDFGKYNLSEIEKQEIDSFLKISNDELLIELFGHTDSVDNVEYNDILSINRVNSVEQYIKEFQNKKITFRKHHFGENNPIIENSSEKNKALNRRVEIKIIPLENGKIIFNGQKGEQAKIDTSYFKNCDICNIKPKFVSYSTEDEANSAGIDLITADGRKLVTGGMMSFDLQGCDKLKKSCINIELSMPSKTIDTLMTGWILNDNNRWVEDTSIITNKNGDKAELNGCIKIGERGVLNWDKPYPSYGILINKHYPKYKFKNNNSSFGELITINKDSLIVLPNSKTLKIITFSKKEAYYLSLDSSEIFHLPSISEKNCFFCLSEIDSSLLKPITYNDTILKIKIRGVKKPLNVGLYNKEYEHFIKITKFKKRKYKSNFLDFPHKITFSIGRDKRYYFDYNEVKTKYKKKKRILKVKIKKKQIRKYDETNYNKT